MSSDSKGRVGGGGFFGFWYFFILPFPVFLAHTICLFKFDLHLVIRVLSAQKMMRLGCVSIGFFSCFLHF